ncbi:enoyl-CoA hydratase/carnithine racemase [Desulfosporosinus orientis DSM 765]|uniref:Enoyl-CoA hydratase/carnithine racemase n=1 Tax=Desulfosporosinus orientis (strain ATCC 19365 / DSM 765 / NCIMB 8382 / VKM B-1628 / Singapore I) TaxID=768706 RepID=G7WHS8_DESOD|nr:enoyl-CoA hydratase/isomerase family protein [Desulfosporosinus orientis]AET69640.1 enoyl-CoA hydratase/carnithine racemase [Desulfosporosinus orientis DSM 765]
MKCDYLIYEEKEGIAYLKLNNPQQKNSLTDELAGELTELLRGLNERDEIKVILLSAVGDVFSAGGNLKAFEKDIELSPAQHYVRLQKNLEIFKSINELHKPLIIGVNGAAFGGGVGLVAAGHLVVASDQAVFGLTEINLGLAPFVIYPIIKEAVGSKKALELMLTAERFTAKQALEFGLVNKVVPAETLEHTLWEFGERYVRLSPLTMDLALKIHNLNREVDLDKMMEIMGVYRIISFTSQDLKEGISSFREKRPANFTGA